MKKRSTRPESFEDVLDAYLARRGFLKAGLALGAAAILPGCSQSDDKQPSGEPPLSTLSFTELPHDLNEHFAVAEGYDAQVLVRWGDPLFENMSGFDPRAQTAQEQERRFGFNNDFIGFVSLPLGSSSSDHGLLVVNHEYTAPQLMHPGSPLGTQLSAAQADVDIAAHGLSVIEIKRVDGQWQQIKNSQYTRRITPNTPMKVSGPAAGNTRLKTIISMDGVHTLGTYGNCAGGVTPWGTILTGEENVDGYFNGDASQTSEAENYARFGVDVTYKNWGDYHPRWNFQENPNELLHMGWIVEIDPFDPNSTPRKRTALGRCKHEGCNIYITDDNHVAAYTGDDQRFEYIYKFISRDRYDPNDREAAMRLLDEGTLYVAKFHDDGRLSWLPLVYGEGPLTEANGFRSQGDVCIDSRKAADLVGATPMDRPEDVEVNPVNGRVYAMLTNNSMRAEGQTDAVNPRAHNAHGQIVEFWPESGDHRDATFRWDLFLLAGKPGTVPTKYHPDISESGWLSCPDNCAFDLHGNLWIATDGAEKSGVADGVWASEVEGPNRALTKRFLRTPIGAELCGPFFTPNNETLFVSVQHPGGDSSFDAPDTRWPDFDASLPPRPSVVAISKRGGGPVGS